MQKRKRRKINSSVGSVGREIEKEGKKTYMRNRLHHVHSSIYPIVRWAAQTKIF
jgi:hypothetical protein